MTKVLQDLYYGEIAPIKQYRPITEEYRGLYGKQILDEQEFRKKINDSLKKEFDELICQYADTLDLELSKAFIDGFRLGAKMMLEIFEEEEEVEE